LRRSWFCLVLACALSLFAEVAHAQDDRKVVSPDGQLEFRLFTSVPEGSNLNCLAYQIWLRGKLLIDTSYLGLNIHFQEPLLGENVGLSQDKASHGEHFNGLFADYLQTSTTGRRIQFEVRVSNDSVAFRYIVPTSPLLVDLLLEDDATQFNFAQNAVADRPARSDLPYAEQEASGEWVSIREQLLPGFPRLQLIRSDAHLMVAHLPDKPHDPNVAFEGKTPWTSPWRMLTIGADRDQLAKSEMLRELNPQ
jgi:hypothetical protein